MIHRGVHADTSPRRRAFSLVESLAVIVVLAIAIPPAVSMMVDGARTQADSVALTRATWYATSLLECVMADVNSDAPGLGFDALADADAYQTTPTTGFDDRNGVVIGHYAKYGLSHDLVIGELSNAAGVVTGDSDQDVFRTVTAQVTWTNRLGQSRTLSIGCLATDLGA
ncbi:MAG: type II secretion system protein [Phycisphaeraceae bacterium]|nr:type II secretion system protein [Phycisphaeraceae bacterium]